MSQIPVQLTEIAARTDHALAEVFGDERARWAALDPALDIPLGDLEDFVAGGGKRLRPAYVHWGFVTGGGDPESDIQLAGCCAVELLQAFALVHDDVMDGSPTRRGHPTVWAKFIERHRDGRWQGEDRRFGEAAAILVGDIAIVMADRQLTGATTAVRKIWDALRTELNMGQYLDVIGTATGEITAEGARLIMKHKTAGYTIVRPLQIGAALAGRPELADALAAHGMPLGIAFQLRDDMLGAFGDSAKTGKPVGDDLREGKPTVLLAKARGTASATQLEVLDRVGQPNLSDHDVSAIQQVMVDTGSVAASERETNQLLGDAISAIESLPDHNGSQSALRALADFVVERDT
ncbi:MAG: polyprenyl synthetase family protein [Acidimicrobiales bacterium]|nr:polyprenyl synthetase family protein [Acidimicrobiales bacterium]MDG2218575.1 polyprenyl synthetase family protein [Acidimicrobiales bacterium]